ncbi:MAG: CocE/NonD family hydrolase [Verrucomicrobiota bacterium]
MVTFALVLSAASALAQGRGGVPAPNELVRSNYTKFEYRIAMRDGIKLFTSVYAPKDSSQAYPIMLMRTPYGVGPYGADAYRGNLGPSDLFAKEGFIFVYQDVRGRGQSEGVFDDPPAHKQRFSGPTDADESTDGYDTIDWLVKNIPNNNGRVGTWGISYPGFFSAFTLINAHPALKAASPQAPMADVGDGDDAYHNGAFFLAENFDFYVSFRPKPAVAVTNLVATAAGALVAAAPRFSMGTPDEYDFFLRLGTLADAEEKYFHHQNEFWSTLVEHDTYDQFWSARALAPQMRHLTAAALVVGGWFDAQDLGGTPKLFQAMVKDGSAPAATLVMGPWAHGSWARGDGDTLGNLKFTEKTGPFYRENIEFPFFVYYLKSKGSGLKTESEATIPKAWVFATGSDQWHRFDTWPPTNAVRRSLYLQAGGKLAFTAAAGGNSQYDEYVSDPAKPVPVASEIVVSLGGDYMTYDQRFASRRPDVLTYETEPLDHAITIVGPVTPVLRVSTSGTDSDFDVKLIDVYPNNYRDPQAAAGGRPIVAGSNGVAQQGTNGRPLQFTNLPAAATGGRRGAPGVAPMGGYQQLVRGEPFRGKFRNSRLKPEAFRPGQPAKIQFDMPDVMHTFLPGHRIMVQIQSSWFPLTDRNPQKFLDIPGAKASDFKKAVERVYRGGAEGSRLDVLVTE